jgi:Leucine-rich repeat (LRR) protein
LQQLVLQEFIALERLPKNIGELSKLQVLDLHGCLTLKRLPSSIGTLKALENLDLTFCVTLETLPNSVGNLSNLKTIRLQFCQNLKELLMMNLQNLVYLWAKGVSFFHLPNSFSNLFNLEVLSLIYCMNLHDLPPSISRLVKLKKLYMGNKKVEKLPKDIGQFKSLEVLHLNKCKQLKTLPKSFRCLEQLEELQISENPCLEVLLERFGKVKAFNYLNIGGCLVEEGIGLVSNFGDLAKLKSLDLDGNLMSTIPESFKDLNALVTLQMSQCPNLVVIQALPSNLERLNIGNCPKLTNIPYLGN